MNRIKICSFILAVTFLTQNNIAFSEKLENIKPGFAKNVIFLISDGTPVTTSTLARWVYNDGKPLNVDEITSGLARTHNSDTPIADSAPAGTALATGWKTQDKLIGVKPTAATLYGAREVKENDKLAPAASVLEASKLMGKAVGIVATSEITHATPADFSAHSTHRNNYSDIGEQQVYQNMNVVLGGGKNFFMPNNDQDPKSKNRIDGENMLSVIKDEGYSIVSNLKELEDSNGDKVWGFFAEKDMPNDIDRDSNNIPSLAQMTEKAIDLLSKDKDGFFLMVEGSKVDWASHANNPIAQISDFKAFDNAVGVALDFAKKNNDTLVVVTTDHGTGGLSIGNQNTAKNYPEIPIENFVTVLKNAKASEEAIAKEIMQNKENTSNIIKEKLGFEPKEEELKEISNTKNERDLQSIIAKIVSERSNLAWTTGGHTGEDVPFYIYTSDSKNQLTGTIQNSDLALYIAKALNTDLDSVTEKLFVPGKNIAKSGLKTKVDTSTPSNPKFIITSKNKDYIFFENKNYYELNNQKKHFNGVVIFNDEEFYIPQAALDEIK